MEERRKSRGSKDKSARKRPGKRVMKEQGSKKRTGGPKKEIMLKEQEPFEQESGATGAEDAEQEIDDQELGYGCSCGEVIADRKDFTGHVMLASRRDGKGSHKSIGRVDMNTGEVVSPPWAGRSIEERKKTKPGKVADSRGNGKSDIRSSQTNILADAQQIRVVPRVFTMDYSPIMRAGQEAAIKIWGWRQDMPLGNFIDTCLFLFFEEKGITLAGYIVHESLLEKEGQDAG